LTGKQTANDGNKSSVGNIATADAARMDEEENLKLTLKVDGDSELTTENLPKSLLQASFKGENSILQDPSEEANSILQDPSEEANSVLQASSEDENPILQDPSEEANSVLQASSEEANCILQSSSEEEYSVLQDPPAEANCILQSCLPFIPQEDDSTKEQVVCPIEANAVCPFEVPMNGALKKMKPIEAEKKLESAWDEQFLILGLGNVLENLLPEEKADLADVKALFLQDSSTKMEVGPLTNRNRSR